MGCMGVPLAALAFVLVLSYAGGQENDTCTTDTCGVSTCAAGYELEVTLDSTSLVISCNECDEDYFKAEESADSCEVCPDGLEAAGTGNTVCTVEAGFWRVDDSSLVVYECPNADACTGGSDLASYCEDGFKGPLCAVCTDDHYPSGGYECVSCSTGNSASTIITVVIFVLVVILFIVLLVKAAAHLEEKARESALDDAANDAALASAMTAGTNSRVFQFLKQWKDTLVVRLKIIIAHFQIVTTFPAVLDVQWPDAFNRYADKFSIINFDIWGILSQGCFFTADFLKELVFTTLLPLAVVGVLVALYFKNARGMAPEARRAAWDSTAGGVLLTGFFFYIVTSTLVLQSFDCQDFEDGSSYLKADYSISCDSDKYEFIYGYAITMALIFPAGIPATYVAVLYLGRSRINPDPLNPAVSTEKREADPTIQKTKFLWGTYRPAVYFYEVWECVRKLFLTGLLVYFKEGTSSQVVIAMLITLAGLRVLAGLRPYHREDENNLAEASLWVTFLTLLAGLLIKSEVAEEDGYDTVALGVILTVMNMALVGLAAFQIVWATSIFFKEKWGDFFGVDASTSYNSTGKPKISPSSERPQSRRVTKKPHSRYATRAPIATPTRERPANVRVPPAQRPRSLNVSPHARLPVEMDYPVRSASNRDASFRPGSTV